MNRPDYLAQGEHARLFPVLATTSKEGRATSILLGCLSKIDEFGAELLRSVQQKIGKRSQIETYTEVVFKGQTIQAKDRPDGLIIVRTGSREWRALVETKIGTAVLEVDQIERYRVLAKEHGVDCVITVSNQFATNASLHPIPEVRKSRSKITVFHWSWMSVLTTADLLISNEKIADVDQRVLLQEFQRFLMHESSGIKGFERMPAEWTGLNKHVAAGGKVQAKPDEVSIVLNAWHQETRDLCLILCRQTETFVTQKIARKHVKEPAERLKSDVLKLREQQHLFAAFDIPNAAAPLEVVADFNRRTIEVGMSLRAPEDRKSTKARLNWLLRQIRTEEESDLFIRLRWPGRTEETQFQAAELRETPEICEKEGTQVISFHIYFAKRIGSRFTQQSNFIADLEQIVPDFYREIGQNLVAWRKAAPKIKPPTVDESEGQMDDEGRKTGGNVD